MNIILYIAMLANGPIILGFEGLNAQSLMETELVAEAQTMKRLPSARA